MHKTSQFALGAATMALATTVLVLPPKPSWLSPSPPSR